MSLGRPAVGRPPRPYPLDASKGGGGVFQSGRDPVIGGAATRAVFAQPIAILRGWACFALGSVSVRTPSSRLALIFS